MTVTIQATSPGEIAKLISSSSHVSLSLAELKTLGQWIGGTPTLRVGMVDGSLVCIFGLIPPTLLSDSAYLWLYTTDAVEEYEFLFVRHSQRAMEGLLKIYPRIVGHCEVGADRSIRWLKWLGAVFDPPEGKLIPFVIRSKNG